MRGLHSIRRIQSIDEGMKEVFFFSRRCRTIQRSTGERQDAAQSTSTSTLSQVKLITLNRWTIPVSSFPRLNCGNGWRGVVRIIHEFQMRGSPEWITTTTTLCLRKNDDERYWKNRRGSCFGQKMTSWSVSNRRCTSLNTLTSIAILVLLLAGWLFSPIRFYLAPFSPPPFQFVD